MIIAIYYVDANFPGYREMATDSIRTAIKANPDAKVYHATDKDTPEIREAHGCMRLPNKIEGMDLVPGKAWMTAWLGQNLEESWALCDADVVHKKPLEPLLDDADVVLLKRDRPGMIVNAGLIMGRPGQLRFWQHYSQCVAELIGEVGGGLPSICHPWWCEQIAFSLMIPPQENVSTLHGARIKLVDMQEIAPVALTIEEARKMDTPVVHLKGRHPKTWFPEFAKEILDAA